MPSPLRSSVHRPRVRATVRASVLALAMACTAAALPAQRTRAAAAAARPAGLTPARIQAALDAAWIRQRGNTGGANADYIPALAAVDPALFGIALVTPDGRVYTAGDTATAVSIQSVSKVFTMALVMEQRGADHIRRTIGVDATGMKFNSIVAVEMYQGTPDINPLVNPGAIAATSMVAGAAGDTTAAGAWRAILDAYGAFAGRPLAVLDDVYRSEAATNQRNQAIGQLMHAYGYITGDPARATDLYTRQCAVGVNAADLARMAATLANGGVNPVTRRRVLREENVPRVLAVMATAGLYENSGQWLYRTGLPAKSGVGGAIIAVSPGRFGIAVISPPLDAAGNSVRAQEAIADIAAALEANPFDPPGGANRP